jgi:hypothetical protein
MSNPTTLSTSSVSDLEFVEKLDELQHNWLIWGVEFTYKGEKFFGSLCGCNIDPDGFHDTEIDGIEKA